MGVALRKEGVRGWRLVTVTCFLRLALQYNADGRGVFVLVSLTSIKKQAKQSSHRSCSVKAL